MSALSSVEILARLVAFPTVSRDPNLPLIEWIRNYLADFGVESHLVPDATGRKANLFAAVGPAVKGGIVFSGHTDVVPIDDQTWNSDPFKLTERDSRLHGRGCCDMKGFIAAVLSWVPVWKESQLRRPVQLMFSYDEEIGCLGAPSMIAKAREKLPTPATVIVGEPTGMRLANQHKGICTLHTSVSGIEAHSSLTHQGVSAVMLAADLIAYLGEISKQVMSSDSPRKEWPFDPPYTTLSVNRIRGGTAVNILARSCEFEWDIRALPGENPAALVQRFTLRANEVLADLLKSGRKCSVETTVRADVPPLKVDDGAAERVARLALQSEFASIAVPFATEAGQFQSAGWSTVVCGPGHIEQAHKPDEYIDRSQLAECERFLERAVMSVCV